MSAFWINFINLCNERGEKPATLCDKLGFSKSTPSMWKRGTVPNQRTLRTVADYFGVAPEYLCNENSVSAEPIPRKAVFWENFVELCNERGISATAAIRQIGLSSGTGTSWKNGAVPRIAVAQKVADYFGVTVERLYHGKTETAADTHKDEVFREIVDTVEHLDEDKQKQLLDYVRFLNSQN